MKRSKRKFVIKGCPEFGQRIVKPKKGKGSYNRKKPNKTDYILNFFFQLLKV